MRRLLPSPSLSTSSYAATAALPPVLSGLTLSLSVRVAQPTLVDLSGLPQPPASEGLEGVSVVPALQDPSAAGTKTMAFSQCEDSNGLSVRLPCLT